MCKADRRLIQIPNGRLFIETSTTHNSLHFSPQATVPCFVDFVSHLT